MFWALALILLAFAGFSLLVIRMRRPSASRSGRLDVEELKGFVEVGAAALFLLAVAVVIVGLVSGPSGGAEALAVLGFFGDRLHADA